MDQRNLFPKEIREREEKAQTLLKMRLLGEMSKQRSRKLVGANDMPSYFIIKLQEEVGEISGAYAKAVRGFNLREFKKMLSKLPKPLNFDDLTPEVKKSEYLRAENSWNKHQELKITGEIVDTFTILLQLASKFGVDYISLIDMSVEKFNRVNKELGEEYTQFNINIDGDEKESK